MLGVKVRVIPVIHRLAGLRCHTGNINLLNPDIHIPGLGWQKFASHYSFEEIIMSIFWGQYEVFLFFCS